MYIIRKYFINSILKGISNVIILKIFNISSGIKKSFKKSGTSSKAFTSKAFVINFINLEKILKTKFELKIFEYLI